MFRATAVERQIHNDLTMHIFIELWRRNSFNSIQGDNVLFLLIQEKLKLFG